LQHVWGNPVPGVLDCDVDKLPLPTGSDFELSSVRHRVVGVADEILEDGDLLEMVAAGLIPATIADSFMVDLWAKVFPALKPHPEVSVATGGDIGWAFRKGSPKLAEAVNAFAKKEKQGTLAGNVLINKYLKSTKWVKNAASEAERRKLLEVVELFKKYGTEYDLDYLLMAAQGYQESGLDQNVKSRVGAIGVMQVMPATGRELNVGDIRKVEANIHAGVKYIRQMIDQNFKDEPMDALNKGLFAFASYNAGPARVRQLRREAEKRGLDPNVWFGNVEQIASERIGRETVTYVSNIYKYYVAYRLMFEERERRAQAKKAVGAGR
jgi:membrane-bound lytic murein transglycosylase MltF